MISSVSTKKTAQDCSLASTFLQMVVMSPQKAFYSEKVSVPVEASSGRVCAEFVMCYPPGIPILAPGEMITDDVVQYILYAKKKGCSMQGTEDPAVDHLMVLANI